MGELNKRSWTNQVRTLCEHLGLSEVYLVGKIISNLINPRRFTSLEVRRFIDEIFNFPESLDKVSYRSL